MEISAIKSNLKNIVLLAKEYKGEVPDSVAKEVANIGEAVENKQAINDYDRQFFNTIQSYRKNWLDQIVYFGERIFLELAQKDKSGRYSRDYKGVFVLDKTKVEEAIKKMTQDETALMEFMNLVIFLPDQFDLNLFLNLVEGIDSKPLKEGTIKTK